MKLLVFEWASARFVSEGIWFWRKWGTTDLWQRKGRMFSLGPFGLFVVSWGPQYIEDVQPSEPHQGATS